MDSCASCNLRFATYCAIAQDPLRLHNNSSAGVRARTLSVILCASCNRWSDIIIDDHCYVVGNQLTDLDKHIYV